MQYYDTSRHEQVSQLQDDLIQTIQNVKHIMALVQEAEPRHHEDLREQLRTHVEQLWNLLAEPLRLSAAKLIRGNLIDAQTAKNQREAVAMEMFIKVYEALPSMRIDSGKNILSYLLIIAQRGITRENINDKSCEQNPFNGETHPSLLTLDDQDNYISSSEHQIRKTNDSPANFDFIKAYNIYIPTLSGRVIKIFISGVLCELECVIHRCLLCKIDLERDAISNTKEKCYLQVLRYLINRKQNVLRSNSNINKSLNSYTRCRLSANASRACQLLRVIHEGLAAFRQMNIQEHRSMRYFCVMTI